MTVARAIFNTHRRTRARRPVKLADIPEILGVDGRLVHGQAGLVWQPIDLEGSNSYPWCSCSRSSEAPGRSRTPRNRRNSPSWPSRHRQSLCARGRIAIRRSGWRSQHPGPPHLLDDRQHVADGIEVRIGHHEPQRRLGPGPDVSLQLRRAPHPLGLGPCRMVDPWRLETGCLDTGEGLGRCPAAIEKLLDDHLAGDA